MPNYRHVNSVSEDKLKAISEVEEINFITIT